MDFVISIFTTLLSYLISAVIIKYTCQLLPPHTFSNTLVECLPVDTYLNMLLGEVL